MRAATRIRRRPFPVTVQPAKADIALARVISRDIAPAPEEVARALTWGADEKVLLILAAASGEREDAFPSGHALHMGALASAAGNLPAGPRRAIRAFAVGLSLTRVAVLAHWASDVVAGFALGAILERLLRAVDRLSTRRIAGER